jgi:predicted nucleic acid-binding protein
VGLTLVDSNVVLDVFTQDPKWFKWSSDSIVEAGIQGGLAINSIIYAETSLRFETIEDLESALSVSDFQRLDLPWEAAFLAAKCFKRYRESGGARRSPLPDFYIGAHAAVAGLTLLTRDSGRYRAYFPKLKIISPAKLH